MIKMLNRPTFDWNDALGTTGDSLVNLSKGKKTDIQALIKQAMDIKAQNQQQPMGELNLSYTLPGNPIDTSADSLNVNPNLVPGGSAGGQDVIQNLMRAIGQTESGNRYGILGQPTKRGDRAYGQYQIMGANMPQWTKEVLGQELTPDQFLASPQAQDAVARAKLGHYLQKTGNINDAASMWFSGRPMRGNQSRDILGTSVPEYVRRVRQAYG